MHKLNASLTAIVALLVIGGMSVAAALIQIQPASATERKAANPTNQNLGDFTEYSQVLAFFYSKVFLERNKTQLTVPFSFKDKLPQPILVGFSTSGDPHEILIYHPQLESLNWSKISDGNLVLYQRQPKYSSIANFLDNPPEVKRIAADPLITGVTHPKLKGGPVTNSELDLDKVDYVLTTYQPVQKQGDIYYAQRVIDATDAVIDPSGQIEWFVHTPNATATNPIYVGNININYLQ